MIYSENDLLKKLTIKGSTVRAKMYLLFWMHYLYTFLKHHILNGKLHFCKILVVANPLRNWKIVNRPSLSLISYLIHFKSTARNNKWTISSHLFWISNAPRGVLGHSFLETFENTKDIFIMKLFLVRKGSTTHVLCYIREIEQSLYRKRVKSRFHCVS